MSPYPTVPGFEFTALIGRGGMATIYSARQLGLDRDVAVKVVEVSGTDAAQYMQRLENEAQSLAQLRHPGIVGLYQFGRTNDGAMYYVMPLLEGGDLAQQPRPMAEDAVIGLLERLLDALDHAHRADIVHRDIKPENILFDSEQRPLLADFGAAQRPSLSRLTEAGMAIGSAGYMSPEQARGQLVDARSDLYSVGVLAYELLTDRLPFEGPDAIAIALAQVEQKPAKLPAGLQQWQRFFERALALDPRQRYASAGEMRAALGEMHTRLAPRHIPTFSGSASNVRRGALIGLAVALLLVVVGVIYGWQSSGSRTIKQIAELIEQDQITDPAQPNAVALMAELEEQDDAAVQALQDRVTERLWADLQLPLEGSDWVGLAAPLRRWHAAIVQMGVADRGLAVSQRESLAIQLQPSLQKALREFDRRSADPLLILLEELQPLPDDIAGVISALQALPSVGDSFSDPEGPALILLNSPTVAEPGLAIMSAPLGRDLYQRFAVNTEQTVRSCSDTESGYRGCLSPREADAIASWLSVQTGHRYRLPTLDELRQHSDLVAQTSALAWTDTCQQITETTRPNAAARTWGGIKKVFGGKGAQAKVERRCQGYWLVDLNSGAVSARTAAATSTTAVLIREIAPTAP